MSGTPAPRKPLFSDTSNVGEFVSYPSRIRSVAKTYPEQVALSVDGITATWAQLMPRINKVSNLLKGRGYAQGETIAVLAKSSMEYMEVFLGALQAGLCIVPLSGMASTRQLEGMIRDCGARMVFLSAGTKELLDPVIDNFDTLAVSDRIAFDFEGVGWTSYENLMEGVSEAEHIQNINPEDPFNLIYSSGTTGVPKGIEQSHHMRSQHTMRFEELGLCQTAVSLCSTALYSNTTLVVLLPTLALGGKVVVMSKFNAEEYLKLAEAEKVTHTMLVPVQYQRILAREDFDKYDLSHFEIKFSTSAPLREGVKKDAIKRWPGKLIEMYGLTEGGIGTALSATDFPDKLASVGKAGEGVDLRIIDEDGNQLPIGDIGEIVGRSDAMMTGYYNRPDLTEKMLWTSVEGKVFFKSGDMGRFDEDGFLFLLDRKKDMIISGGFNIYATDIEEELVAHSDVADVAVIGIPSDAWGETPLALVVPRTGSTCTEEEMKAWVNERLGKSQRISGVVFRDNLPRSTIGKVLKRELRDEYKN